MAFPRKQQRQKENAMGSASTSTQRVDEGHNSSHKSSNSSKSYFQQTVCLKDWWLVRADTDFHGKTLAVAGFTSRENQALRVFSSAPILKIYDVFTLETVDGICVVLKGFINKSRTEKNGFPSEVFDHFVFGFPPYWEVYNEQLLDKGSKEVRDLKKKDEKNHVEATSEETQEHNERNDYEVEGSLKRDNQNDEKVASEVTVRKKTKKAVRSSNKLHSTKTAKEQTAHDSKATHFRSRSASTTNTKRKLVYESPVSQKGKEAVSVISAEPLSFNRSRSGRLLLPPMAFWRNQRAIYDADHGVTAINQGDLDLDIRSKGTNGKA